MTSLESEPAPHGGMTSIESLQKQIDELCARLSQIALLASGKPPRSEFLQEILRARRERVALFGQDLLGEPAWEILLELYAAELDGRRLLVSKVGQANGIAQSTALRWMAKLEAAGWTSRAPDAHRGRRIFAMLTDQASTAMRTYVDGVFSRQLLL